MPHPPPTSNQNHQNQKQPTPIPQPPTSTHASGQNAEMGDSSSRGVDQPLNMLDMSSSAGAHSTRSSKTKISPEVAKALQELHNW